MSSILRVEGVFSGYGGNDIIKGVDMHVDEGEIVTVIGPNGAGKSTLIKTIAGLVKVREGSIHLHNKPTADLRASDVAHLGMSYVPQEGNVFRKLSVQENLDLGDWISKPGKKARLEKVYELFPPLKERRNATAGNLSGGQRQMVALGMALMADPNILLLDEPSAGLSPKLVEEMFQIICDVNSDGVAIYMVEQNAIQALKMSHRGYVLAGGQVKLADTAEALLNDTEVRHLYLGVTD